MGIQLCQVELRLGKTPFRSFKPLNSTENFWQILELCSLRVPFALDRSWSLESKVMRECCLVVERDAWLRGLIGLAVDYYHQLGSLYLEMEVMCVKFGCHFKVELECKFTLSPLVVLQGFSFFLQMGFTLIFATLDGLDVGLLGDVIGEDDCDDDG
ncbi:hypothetical protein Tco_1205352 [Tanacetum coccineum]